MAIFWKWGVRNIALVFTAFSLVLGYAGAADWSIALVSAMIWALIAKAADSLYQVNRGRARRKAIVIELSEARRRSVSRSTFEGRMRGNRAA